MSAQNMPEKTRILFVLDASGSMYGKWQGKLKMSSAKEILSNLVDSLEQIPNVEMALRVYGHQHKQDCEDTKLEVGFKPGNSQPIKDVLIQLKPKGRTPIAYSLEQAATDFSRGENARNIIILITDGVEECDGDPCALSKKLQENHVVLKPFVIGLGIDKGLTGRFKCMGKFYNASSEESFKTIMRVVVSQVLDNTTIQINLLDEDNQPTETNVGMTFSDAETGFGWYHFVHTLDEQKKPDKFVVEASPTYNIKIHTLPPVYKRNVRLTSGQNNEVDIKVPQGELKLSMIGSMYYKSLKCAVYKSGTRELINVQDINTAEKYLVGKYDIEVFTLPVTTINEVEVFARNITEEVVQNPGQLVVNYIGAFEGAIYENKNGSVQFVKRVDPGIRKEIVYIQPGNYLFVVRTSGATKTLYSNRREFIIHSNNTRTVTIKN
ncbi:MAG: VWA domain-containing protein [Bacteroidetes bacterium]|nr:VWA domain-containing protein [Bacteroidota bacterium]